MSSTITEIEENLTGMGHGGTLKKVRNIYSLYERTANTILTKIDPVETIRRQSLSSAVHDDLQNYPLPSDYKKIIDISPYEDRSSLDRASRIGLEQFASGINSRNKELAIEANEGVKFLRLNWKETSAKTLHTMDSLTSNGTIAVVASASGLKVNTLYKLSGTASVEFDITVSGDGIQGTGLTSLDLSSWDELADWIVPIWLGDASKLTSISFIFGNDLSANYWTAPAQTAQADGTAFKAGWNFILCPWSSATETGTVDPAKIDSFKITFATTGAITNVRVDNILVSLGRIFELKYYSQYLFINSSGTWIKKPSAITDSLILSGTALQIFLLESLIAMAQQMEGKDSVFDIDYGKTELAELYQRYRAEHPSNAKREVGRWWGNLRFRR